jgi:hypothetical protein
LRLDPGQLRRRLDPATLPFETTAEVEPLMGTIGQPRALSAIEFGLEIETWFQRVRRGRGRLRPIEHRPGLFGAVREGETEPA